VLDDELHGVLHLLFSHAPPDRSADLLL